MVEGITTNGFKYRIEDEKLDDYEMFEKLCAIDNDNANIGLIVNVFTDLLGLDQYNALKEHLRREKGRVGTREMLMTLREILNSEEDNELKNS